MQLRHQGRQVAVRGNEIVIHVARMTGEVAQPRDAGNFREPVHQTPERGGVAVAVLAVISVDVLAEQRDLADAGVGQALGLGDDPGDRTRHFGAARVGHDAERAELVAAFLHGDEGRHAALARRRTAWRCEVPELVLDRKFGVDCLALLGALQHVRQAVVALRPDHEIDRALTADDLGALGLRDAAGDGDFHVASLQRGFLLEHAHAAELGIDLLGRLLADVAGVEDDQVGVVRRGGLDEALGGQRVRHTMRIVDVHLAAVGLDVELFGHAVADEFPNIFSRLIYRAAGVMGPPAAMVLAVSDRKRKRESASPLLPPPTSS